MIRVCSNINGRLGSLPLFQGGGVALAPCGKCMQMGAVALIRVSVRPHGMIRVCSNINERLGLSLPLFQGGGVALAPCGKCMRMGAFALIRVRVRAGKKMTAMRALTMVAKHSAGAALQMVVKSLRLAQRSRSTRFGVASQPIRRPGAPRDLETPPKDMAWE